MMLFLVYLFAGALAQPMVEIDNGLVMGNTVNTHYDKAVNSFYGIPFGLPPIGDLRFDRPHKALPWGGDVFEATSLGTSCMQNPSSLWLTHPGWRNIDEDCLNLNVFTPEDMDPEERYPVMVYFYGGAYGSGANIMYPGHFLATRDVIVVVPNYRIGIFGFINTGDDAAPGNYGLWDQHLALEWVQSNIEAFGGDPERVTIFGQSAGASSAGLHVISPHSKGLFHQVIQQSGTDMNFWTLNYPPSDPPDYTRQVAEKNDCPTDDTVEMVECLRELDQWQLRNNSGVTCTPGHFCQSHAPVVDGPGYFVPDWPQRLRDAGDFNTEVNIMSGYNTEDGSLYTLGYIPEAMEGGFNRSEFQRLLRENLLGMWADQFEPEVFLDAEQATDFQYTPWPYLEDKDLNRDAFNAMITDAAFGYVCDKMLLSQSSYSDSNYKYLFGYRSNRTLDGTGIWNGTEWAGVPHSAEIPYVMGWALMPESPQVRLDARWLVDLVEYIDEDFAYADFVQTLFTNFVKYGNPTPEPVDAPLGNDPVTWEKYTPDELNIIYMSRDIRSDINYLAKENAWFLTYLSYILDRELFYDPAHPEVVRGDGKGMESDVLEKLVDKIAKEFLTKVYPGEYDQLFENNK